ncbi:DUF2771 domain-containing protein [Streptomyces sp. NPDC004838]
MTVAFFSGRRRRAAATIGAVSAGLLVLSACEKPTPLATVTVGTNSVSSEATCYNGGDPIKESEVQDCLKESGKTIKVALDDRVRFGVDPEIADNGWTLFIEGRNAEAEPYKKTYRSVPASAFFAGEPGTAATNSASISIVETKKGKLVGIWQFTLEKTS